MKRSYVIALIALGCATVVGLGVIFRIAFPELLSGEPAILAPVLVVAVAAALFVFGVFMGFLHGRSSSNRGIPKGTMDRFREALNFERQERTRLERELYEAKQLTVSLEDRLQQESSNIRNNKEPDAENKKELDQLQIEISELTARQEHLHDDLFKRKERIADLFAELSLAQVEAEEARTEVERLKASCEPAHPAMKPLPGGTSIKDVLEGIVVLDGVKTALVADDCGLVVETAGDAPTSETLAAISSMIAELGPRVRDIFPMGELSTVCLEDDQGLIVDTCYFDLLGTRCALAIARDAEHPYSGIARETIHSITSQFKE
ncbi:MAG: hypothetical protein GY847_30095 [Proteobacteria bacterium]|nr:hypothetical protein [Pseudomonadota bacterium]